MLEGTARGLLTLELAEVFGRSVNPASLTEYVADLWYWGWLYRVRKHRHRDDRNYPKHSHLVCGVASVASKFF